MLTSLFYNLHLRCLNNQPKDYFEQDQVSGDVRNNVLRRLTKHQFRLIRAVHMRSWCTSGIFCEFFVLVIVSVVEPQARHHIIFPRSLVSWLASRSVQ